MPHPIHVEHKSHLRCLPGKRMLRAVPQRRLGKERRCSVQEQPMPVAIHVCADFVRLSPGTPPGFLMT